MKIKHLVLSVCLLAMSFLFSCSERVEVTGDQPSSGGPAAMSGTVTNTSTNTSADTDTDTDTNTEAAYLYPIMGSLDKWGYIDQKGTVVIKPEYDVAYMFSEGLAVVSKGEKYGFIDKYGNLTIDLQFPIVSGFSEGKANYRDEDSRKCGYIDKNGSVVIPPMYDQAGDFKEGLAPVEVNNKWGFIDGNGDYVIEPRFDYVWGFSEGLARVIVGQNSGYVDKSGRYAIEPVFFGDIFEEPGDFSEGLAPVRMPDEEIWGYIDKLGKFRIEREYEYADNFSEGLACVSQNGLSGYIDKNGKTIIDFKYREAYPFSDGLAMVKKDEDGGYGYIDKNGREVTGFNFVRQTTQAYFITMDFRGGVARVLEKDGSWGYINTDGQYIWNSNGYEAEMESYGKIILDKYEGDWAGDDFKKVTDTDGNEVQTGGKLWIEEGKDSDILISLAYISTLPARRAAGIDAKLYFTGEDSACFSFDDDGWRNSGNGTITFDGDTITVNIEFEQYDEESLWSMFEGRMVFSRMEQ